MKQRIKLHIGAIEVKLGFWARFYLMIRKMWDGVDVPISSVSFGGLDLELEGEIDKEAYSKCLDHSKKLAEQLGSFFAPYAKTILDQYVDDVARHL